MRCPLLGLDLPITGRLHQANKPLKFPNHNQLTGDIDRYRVPLAAEKQVFFLRVKVTFAHCDIIL